MNYSICGDLWTILALYQILWLTLVLCFSISYSAFVIIDILYCICTSTV